MKTYSECIPCFFQQALRAAGHAQASMAQTKEILQTLAKQVKDFSWDNPPPVMGAFLYGCVRKITGQHDPFENLKKQSNQLALQLYPVAKQMVESADEPLAMAVQLAIAGNSIDFGIYRTINLQIELHAILEHHNQKCADSTLLFQYDQFFTALIQAQNIVYVADNAGEIVFDRVLIEEILQHYPMKKITAVVRGGPIINDVLMKDAQAVGLDKVVEVIASKDHLPGIIWKHCGPQVQQAFNSADMIIAKGQGNFETLSDSHWPIYFLFKAKCKCVTYGISEKVGFEDKVICQQGDVILLQNDNKKAKSHVGTDSCAELK